MQRAGAAAPKENQEPGTVVHIAEKGKYLGSITVSDTLKPQAAQALDDLRKDGVTRLVMLTGDRPGAAAKVAAELGITDWRASLLPQDKVAAVAEMEKAEPKGHKLAFVGDGINDAPTLALADVGIAMGNAPDFLKEKADYVTDSIDHDGVVTALEHFGLI